MTAESPPPTPRLALELPTSLPWQEAAALARRAQADGFDAVWVPDHGLLDPVAVVGALAVVTRCVILVLGAGPHRAPAPLAKAAATLSRLSGGRLEVALAGGERQRLEEVALVVGSMLSAPRTTFSGRYVAVEDAPNLPPPEGRVPLWIEGEAAATVGDGWHLGRTGPPAGYARAVRALERACRRAGRDPREVRRSVGLLMSRDDPRELLRAFAAAGADQVVVSFGGSFDGGAYQRFVEGVLRP